MKKIIFLIIFVAIAGFLAWLSTPFNILIIGSDAYANEPTKGSRSDGLILVKVVPLKAQIKMVSIPRDSYVELQCHNYKMDKITHTHAYGGTPCTIETIEKLLDLKINYHILFRFEDLMNITTLIDGVDVVANHTFNQDYFDQEVFHFNKGQSYNLKGRQALAYTRHRKSDTAFKRDERQRQVMQGIIEKLSKPSGWKYIPKVLDYTKQNMEVEANPIKALSAAPAILLKKPIEQYELQGDGRMINGVYYYILNDNSLNDIIYEFQN